MEKLTRQLDEKLIRIGGMKSILDYVVEDMLDSTSKPLEGGDCTLMITTAYADRLSLKRAVSALSNIASDLESIEKLLNAVYAPVCEAQRASEMKKRA